MKVIAAGVPLAKSPSMNSALHQRVRRTIRRHALIGAGGRVLIGVSGGSDSVALTFLLRDLSVHGNFSVVAIAHFNHRLRSTAARDEEFCRRLAERLTIQFVLGSADVAAHAAEHRLSVEDAARRLRYDFLRRAAVERGADTIAVGHTQDDQAETFLMKLMRGASLAGLAGVYPRRGPVVRPLLDASRDDLRAYLSSIGEVWVDDETNTDLRNPRNRIRHKVLAELDATLGGASRPNLARAAALAREDGEWLDEVANAHFRELVVSRTDGDLELDRGGLARLPQALARRVVVRALRIVAGGREVNQQHVEGVLALMGGETGGLDVPGGRMEPRADKLVLIQQKAAPK